MTEALSSAPTGDGALVGVLPAAAATVPFARELSRFGERVALLTPDGPVSYRELAARVDAAAAQLGERRRLVLLAGANRLDAVVVYLAALAGGHPVLLAPGDRPGTLASLAAAYDPDVVAGAAALDERRATSAHTLHPELALLLTTSGTTGSAKLVRLSHHNLQSNAEAIADCLGIRPDDRAATTLPLHYCYGLSVVNSYLLRGASLLLTDRSVTDPEFWHQFQAQRCTSLAGVPYTFDLLDRVGFADLRLPHLRYVTQAGGRLAPERVRHYAELGRRSGWDFYVMYGQTEATARMGYLPPGLAAEHPECIGVPVPGGSFRLDPLPEWSEPGSRESGSPAAPDVGEEVGEEVGELVYQGPNVMLGYAESPADLGRGRSVTELRTGDVARRTPAGLYQIVGRRSRFVKLYGLRVDLQRVEEVLAGRGLTGCCTGSDDGLAIAVEPATADAGQVRRLVAGECGLPERAVRVCPVAAVPRLPSGKPDYPAVAALAAGSAAESADVRRIYAEVLARPDATDRDTFVSLGGDSLSYVELSVRLERALGWLPDQWHTTPIRDLRPARRARWGRATGRGWWLGLADVDTGVALRAVAIFLIVGTHAGLFAIAGGAHLLLGVAGFNFARFHLTATARLDRVRHLGRSIGRVFVTSATWIALVVLVTDSYALPNVFLLNYFLGSPETRGGWHFWFLESLVYLQVATLLVLALPVVDRLERRFPFGLPMGLVGLGMVTRYELVPGVELATPLRVIWLFALGWAAAKATGWRQRALVTVAIVATLPGFFDSPRRVGIVIAGLVLLVWVSRLPSVRPLNRLLGLLAGASLFIYLTHWQVYPHLTGISPAVAVVASLVVGVAYAAGTRLVGARIAGPRLAVARLAGRPGRTSTSCSNASPPTKPDHQPPPNPRRTYAEDP